MKNRVDDYVLGNLSPEERAAMDQARRHDPLFDQMIEDAEDRLAPLSLAPSQRRVPDALWNRIEAALDHEQDEMAGRTAIMFDDGDWHDLLPGVKRKFLWNERARLLRCAPGAVIPEHRHTVDENVLVLSGDLHMCGRAFGPGDCLESPAGSMHGLATTQGGCLVLIQHAS